MQEYEIIKLNWADPRGLRSKSVYQIRWQCKTWLLRRNYWKYVTSTTSPNPHAVKTRTDFKSLHLAEYHIREVLCKGLKTQTTFIEAISTIKCNK